MLGNPVIIQQAEASGFRARGFRHMEEVDVVDAHDNVVGKAKREEAHRKGLLHRVVFVFLFDPDGKLYVQKRVASKDMYPNCWEGSLSGHVLSGETYKEAAERELHEELGACVSGRHLKEIIKFGNHDGNERVLITLFAVKDFKENMTIDKEEVNSGEFWTIKKLESELKKQSNFNPGFIKAWEEFKAMKEKAVEFVKL